MESFFEWNFALILAIIGTFLLFIMIMGAHGPLLNGLLQVMSLSSAPTNFFRNQFEILKWVAGSGPGPG